MIIEVKEQFDLINGMENSSGCEGNWELQTKMCYNDGNTQGREKNATALVVRNR
jgi:hypothetical protein